MQPATNQSRFPFGSLRSTYDRTFARVLKASARNEGIQSKSNYGPVNVPFESKPETFRHLFQERL
jgi:hypothetical protein